MEDFEGWEVVPDEGFLEIHDDADGKKIFSRKFGVGSNNNVLKNYFICPSPTKSPQFVDSTVVTVPIELEPTPVDNHQESVPDHEFLKKLTHPPHPIQINITPSSATMPEIVDLVSQVSFKKLDPEFVEMKLDSPRSNNNSSRSIKSQVDAGSFQFDDKETILENKISSPKFRTHGDDDDEEPMVDMDQEGEKEVNWEENSGGNNIWKWSLTGIGAICSFGVVAATVCIIVLGGKQKNKQQDNQKLQFHIYADHDKRLKQVVEQASKLNEAISTVRGRVPLRRAHITVGGYYDGL